MSKKKYWIMASILLIVIAGIWAICNILSNAQEKRERVAEQLQCMNDMREVIALKLKDYRDSTLDNKGKYLNSEGISKILADRPGCSARQWKVFVPLNWEIIKHLDGESVGKIPLFYCPRHNTMITQNMDGVAYKKVDGPQDIIQKAQIPESVKKILVVK